VFSFSIGSNFDLAKVIPSFETAISFFIVSLSCKQYSKQMALNIIVLVIKDIDINEHEKLSNILT
jgi:hypothetical protein